MPVKLLDAGDHQNAHIDQGGCRRARRDQRGNGGEEHGNEEESGSGDGGKTGTATLSNTGSSFDEGGDSGGAADGTDGGSNCVCKHGLVHVGNFALVGQQIAPGAGTVEGAEGIKHIDHAEGESSGGKHQNEVAGTMGVNIRLKVEAFRKDLAQRLTEEILERADKIDLHAGFHAFGKACYGGKAQNVVKHSADKNTPQDRAAHLLLGEDRNDTQRNDCYDHGHNIRPGVCAADEIEGAEGNARAGIRNDNACVLQTEESNKESDTGGNRFSDCVGNRGEDLLAQTGDGEQNEDDAVGKDEHKRVGVAQAETDADGVDEEGVQAHAGGLCQRQICQKTDEQGTNDCGNCCGNVDRTIADAENVGSVTERIGKHPCVDHQNVRHCHEGCQTGKNFGSDCGVVLFQTK